MAYTNEVRRLVRGVASGTYNRILVSGSGIVGIGVLLTYAFFSSLTPSRERTVNELLTVEYGSGSYQILAGVTESSHIYSKSGGLIAGPLQNPYFEFSATGSKARLNRVNYTFPSAACTNGQVWKQDGSGGISCAADNTGGGGGGGGGLSFTGNALTLMHAATATTVSGSNIRITSNLRSLYGATFIHASTLSGSRVHSSTLFTASGTVSVDGTIFAQGGVTGDLTGNATTATALASNPSDCSANQFANTIAASGNLTCAAIADADVPDTITVTLASTATALAANGANCAAGNYPLGVDASGAVESCTAVGSGGNWSNTGALTAAFDSRYVNQSGDTMTGALQIANGKNLSVSGSIIGEGNLTLNDDDGAVDVVITFTNSGTDETFSWVEASDWFELSDDLRVIGNTTTTGVMSGNTLVVSGTNSCTFAGTSSAGAFQCNNTVDDTEMTAEDFGDFTCSGSEDGCTVDANAIALTTDTTGNYAAGDAEAGAALTGDSATAFFSAGQIELARGGTNASLTAAAGGVIYSTASAMAVTAAGSQDQVLRSNGTSAPTWGTVTLTGSMVWFVGSGSVVTDASGAPDAIHTMSLKNVVINMKEAPTGAAFIVDINEGGTTVFSTRPQVNDGGTSEAGTHAFSDTTIARGAKVTLDIDQIGSTFAGERITIQLLYTYNPFF